MMVQSFKFTEGDIVDNSPEVVFTELNVTI